MEASSTTQDDPDCIILDEPPKKIQKTETKTKKPITELIVIDDDDEPTNTSNVETYDDIVREAREFLMSLRRKKPKPLTFINYKVFYSVNELLDLKPNAENVKHIIFIDLDNWPAFWTRLPFSLPQNVLILCFIGGHAKCLIPKNCKAFNEAVAYNRVGFTLCGSTKNAADFALSMKVAQMDFTIQKDVPFTILSGDKGLDEVKNHVKNRKLNRINPHYKTDHETYLLLKSITDL